MKNARADTRDLTDADYLELGRAAVRRFEEMDTETESKVKALLSAIAFLDVFAAHVGEIMTAKEAERGN